MGALWDGGSFKKAEVDAAVADLLSASVPAHATAQPLDEPAPSSCPTCNAAAVPAPVNPERAVKVYLAMRRLVDRHGLSCLTVRCFDIVAAQQTSGEQGQWVCRQCVSWRQSSILPGHCFVMRACRAGWSNC